MKRIEEIRQKRQGTYIMQRLRKARELETKRDIKEVQRDISLIQSPAAGMYKEFLKIFLLYFMIPIDIGVKPFSTDY